MKDTLKEIRYPLVALFLLTVLTAFTRAETQRLEAAALRVETLEIGKLILAAKPANVVVNSGSDALDGGGFRAEQGFQFRDARDQSKDAIEFLEAFKLCSAPYVCEMPMVTGGWLQLSYGNMAPPDFAVRLKDEVETVRTWAKVRAEYEMPKVHFQRATRPLPPDTSGAEHSTQKSRPQHARPAADPAAVPVGVAVPLPTPAPVSTESSLFYVEIVTDTPVGEARSTLGPSGRFVVTNVERVEEWDTVTQSRHINYKPGTLTVFIPSIPREHSLASRTAYLSMPSGAVDGWEGPLDVKALQSAALQEARPFGVTSDKLDEVYREMRKKYEEQEVFVPGLGLAVRSASFVGYAFGVAMGLAAWASFLLRRLRQTFGGDEGEPWVLVEPFRAFRQARIWDRPVAALEILLFTAFHLVAFLTPAALGAALLDTDQLDSTWLSTGALALGTLMSLSLLASYVGIVWMAIHSTLQSEISAAK